PAASSAPVPARPDPLRSGQQIAHPGVQFAGQNEEGLADGEPVLAVDDVRVHFGGVQALADVSIEARPGEIVGLIGSNGAGKSTLMNVVSGFITPDAGTVHAFGEDITALAPHERAALGIGRVFQDARLFGDLTVRESIMVALERTERSEVVPSMLALPPAL